MSGVVRLFGAGLLAAALSGCLNAYTTRFPTLMPSPNAVERRSMGHFDPLPDHNLGPETNTRPAEFTRAREPQRQSQEGRFLQGAPATPVPPGFSSGAYRDTEVVR